MRHPAHTQPEHHRELNDAIDTIVMVAGSQQLLRASTFHYLSEYSCTLESDEICIYDSVLQQVQQDLQGVCRSLRCSLARGKSTLLYWMTH